MKRDFVIVIAFSVIVLFAASAFAQHQSQDEQSVWKLEHDYWEYVKAVDLDRYRNLWHTNFLGWPSVSPRPARKDHITDWITAHSEKGERLQSFTLDEADSQATENLVVVHYWLTATWGSKDAVGKPSTLRMTHTWIRTPGGWKIISGMSTPGEKPAN